MEKNLMYTLRNGVSYYKIKGHYYRNSGYLEVEIEKEDYDKAIELFYKQDEEIKKGERYGKENKNNKYSYKLRRL